MAERTFCADHTKRSWVLPTMLGIGGLAAIIGIGYMATK